MMMMNKNTNVSRKGMSDALTTAILFGFAPAALLTMILLSNFFG
ncbi:MAG: hypothetical protein U0J65_09445 [Christensenellales bacterium]|nr:hypothetical protein [Christensenellales bacterium]